MHLSCDICDWKRSFSDLWAIHCATVELNIIFKIFYIYLHIFRQNSMIFNFRFYLGKHTFKRAKIDIT